MKNVVLLVIVGFAVGCASLSLAETRVLVVAGLGGEPDYQTAFDEQAEAGARHMGAVASDVVLLTGPTANRERLQRELAGLAERAARDDAVVLLLVGHGSFDERDYRFNVPGPDVTGDELAEWLGALPASRQLVVVATSASGALQPLLAGGGRTVITATRSGGERNVTVFPRYFAEALSEAAADTDKDGYVSGGEAFRYAEAAVAAHFEQRRQMATEHPVLEGAEAQVMLARLDGGSAFPAASGAEGDRLEALEAEIAALRADKDKRDADTYYADLQRLLLEVAMLRRRLGQDGAP